MTKFPSSTTRMCPFRDEQLPTIQQKRRQKLTQRKAYPYLHNHGTVLYAMIVDEPMESSCKTFDSSSTVRALNLNRLTSLHVNIEIHKHLSPGMFKETHRSRGARASPRRHLRPKTARLRLSRILRYAYRTGASRKQGCAPCTGDIPWKKYDS